MPECLACLVHIQVAGMILGPAAGCFSWSQVSLSPFWQKLEWYLKICHDYFLNWSILNLAVTDIIWKSPWEAVGLSTGQKIPSYGFWFFIIVFTIVPTGPSFETFEFSPHIPSVPMSCRWSVPFRFSSYNFVCCSHFPHVLYVLLIRSPRFFHPNSILWRKQIIKLLKMYSPPILALLPQSIP